MGRSSGWPSERGYGNPTSWSGFLLISLHRYGRNCLMYGDSTLKSYNTREGPRVRFCVDLVLLLPLGGDFSPSSSARSKIRAGRFHASWHQCCEPIAMLNATITTEDV